MKIVSKDIVIKEFKGFDPKASSFVAECSNKVMPEVGGMDLSQQLQLETHMAHDTEAKIFGDNLS